MPAQTACHNQPDQTFVAPSNVLNPSLLAKAASSICWRFRMASKILKAISRLLAEVAALLGVCFFFPEAALIERFFDCFLGAAFFRFAFSDNLGRF